MAQPPQTHSHRKLWQQWKGWSFRFDDDDDDDGGDKILMIIWIWMATLEDSTVLDLFSACVDHFDITRLYSGRDYNGQIVRIYNIRISQIHRGECLNFKLNLGYLTSGYLHVGVVVIICSYASKTMYYLKAYVNILVPTLIHISPSRFRSVRPCRHKSWQWKKLQHEMICERMTVFQNTKKNIMNSAKLSDSYTGVRPISDIYTILRTQSVIEFVLITISKDKKSHAQWQIEWQL